MKQKILSAILVSAIILSMTGCGGAQPAEILDSKPSQESEVTTQTTSATTTEKQEQTESETTITTTTTETTTTEEITETTEAIEEINDFTDDDFIYYEVLSDDNELEGYGISGWDKNKKLPANLTIPAEHAGKPVVQITAFFENNETLKIVTLPDTITNIDASVFAYCGSVETINLPKNLSSLGDEVFYRCVNLKKLKYQKVLSKSGTERSKNVKISHILIFLIQLKK